MHAEISWYRTFNEVPKQLSLETYQGHELFRLMHFMEQTNPQELHMLLAYFMQRKG